VVKHVTEIPIYQTIKTDILAVAVNLTHGTSAKYGESIIQAWIISEALTLGFSLRFAAEQTTIDGVMLKQYSTDEIKQYSTDEIKQYSTDEIKQISQTGERK
jgi:hypothetical protein